MDIQLITAEVPKPVCEAAEILPVAEGALKQVFTELINDLNKLSVLRNVKPMISTGDYPNIEFPADGSTIEVEVVLVGSREAFYEYNVDPDDVQGLFAVHSGIFDEDLYADRLRVLVLCDEGDLLQFMLDERSSEMDPSSDRYDGDMIFAYLNTLTHELAHAVEFATHGHGLTPRQVDMWHDMGELDRDIEDICTGRWIRDDMHDDRFTCAAYTNEVMEDRVEQKGKEYLYACLDSGSESLHLALRQLQQDVGQRINHELEPQGRCVSRP